MVGGSQGLAAPCGVLSLALLEASLCLLVVDREPCYHLPCSPGGPLSWPLWGWTFLPQGPCGCLWTGAGEVRRVGVSLVLQLCSVVMLILKGVLI